MPSAGNLAIFQWQSYEITSAEQNKFMLLGFYATTIILHAMTFHQYSMTFP